MIVFDDWNRSSITDVGLTIELNQNKELRR